MVEVKQKIKLIKPDEATGVVKEVFEEIKKIKGVRYLTPSWGFWGLDPVVLKYRWELSKKALLIEDKTVTKRMLEAIALICAQDANCKRCINNHQTRLMEEYGMTPEDIEDILDFENSDIPLQEKVLLRFVSKLVKGEEVTNEEFNDLKDQGFDDKDIVFISATAFKESAASKHAVVLARFEDGENWPRENTPSEFYADNVSDL